MKKHAIYVVIIALICFAGSMAQAADIMVKDAKITSAVTKLDKNGQTYVRIIIEQEKTLSGITYTDGTPVMAFGNFATEAARQLKAGDTINAICSSREYKGSTYLTVKKWLK